MAGPGGPADLLVAYFSAEFGLDESLPIYSGGLGVLAGDYLKAASELGIPLVGIGLFYRRGYFEQRLDENDRQIEHYPLTDTSRLPLELVPMAPVVELADDSGELVPVRLGIWRVRVGRVSLYPDRHPGRGKPGLGANVTDTLYGGDRENRLRQEVVLGVGGVRVLRGLGLEPTVFHLNEGHSAFLQLERMRELVEEQEPVGRRGARAAARLHRLHHAHAGARGERGVRSRARAAQPSAGSSSVAVSAWEEFVSLGKSEAGRERIRAYAVRAPHVAVRERASRSSTAPCRARCGKDSGPSNASTRSRSPRSRTASTSALGSPASWRFCSATPTRSSSARASCRPRTSGRRSAAQRSGCSRYVVTTRGARELDPDVLTIGFARRFATYKRASLLFSRPERLAQLLADSERPIQVLVAGKAHPADEDGKDLIQLVVDFAREPTAAGRVVFLEDYEMTLARRLVQGVDIWLNTPRRPFEASGTSGMKAALNGVLNCSILDGWWAEAYSPAVRFRDRAFRGSR